MKIENWQFSFQKANIFLKLQVRSIANYFLRNIERKKRKIRNDCLFPHVLATQMLQIHRYVSKPENFFSRVIEMWNKANKATTLQQSKVLFLLFRFLYILSGQMHCFSVWIVIEQKKQLDLLHFQDSAHVKIYTLSVGRLR